MSVEHTLLCAVRVLPVTRGHAGDGGRHVAQEQDAPARLVT